MVLLEPKNTIMGLDRSAIFGSVGHQTSCDIYCWKNSSVLKSQLSINLSLSQVVGPNSIGLEHQSQPWFIPFNRRNTTVNTNLQSFYKDWQGNGFLQKIRSKAAQKRKHRKLMLGRSPQKSAITWCNCTKDREESRWPKWLVTERGLFHY